MSLEMLWRNPVSAAHMCDHVLLVMTQNSGAVHKKIAVDKNIL